MAKKGTYRAISVEQVRGTEVAERLADAAKVVVAVDVAKDEFVSALGGERGEVLSLWKVRQPDQLDVFFELVRKLAGLRDVELVVEPTGTYGDVLIYQAKQRGFRVFRVSPKHTSDAKEVFDGVPSKHDAKDSAMLLWLHVHGRSKPWTADDEQRREMKASLDLRQTFEDGLQRNQGRLEGKLARHWPELARCCDVYATTTLRLLKEYGSPAEVARAGEAAHAMLARAFRRERATEIMLTADSTKGVPMLASEVRALKALASEMLHDREEIDAIDVQLRELVASDASASRMATTIGPVAAAAAIGDVGDPTEFASAHNYEKAIGLNLRVSESGKYKGQLRITKRGPGRVRRYLYMAVLRLLADNDVVRAWYAKKLARSPNLKKLAIVAIMRKLCRAMVQVAKDGSAFDAAKLFDTRALGLEARAAAE